VFVSPDEVGMPAARTYFRLSAGAILVFTGIAKVLSALGSAHILQNTDPIFGLQFDNLMLIAGVWELGIAGVCLFSKSQILTAILVAWLATNLLLYRLVLFWIGWQRPCSCLGNLTDALHIPPQTVDGAMKIVLGYLLIGSYATLFWLWKEKRKQSPL
jgi:hypothetical protein